jgi:hypothetical protein
MYPVSCVIETTQFDWSSGELAEGWACYGRRQFFEAHEHWEAVWLRSVEPERNFVQALIQLASALHHFQRHNWRGATGLLVRALGRLQAYPPRFQQVEVAWLRDEMTLWLKLLESHASAENTAFPQIRFVGAGELED